MTVWPNGSRTMPRVTSEYGSRIHPITKVRTFHAGIDIVGFTNNCAPFAGTVEYAQYNGGAGNEIRIRRSAFHVHQARLKHNARFLVSVGQKVSEGQPVGVMGTTGASTGVHCHFETWTAASVHINPRTFMAATSTPSGGGGTPISTTQGDDEEMYVTALNAGGIARAGYFYKRVNGSWAGITNLERETFVRVFERTGGEVVGLNGTDLDLMFAVDGLWEQVELVDAPQWGAGNSLMGLGVLTGRRIFPGSAGILGQWHYPSQLGVVAAAPGPVKLSASDLATIVSELKAAIPAFPKVPTAQENADAVVTEQADRLDGLNDGK